MATSSRSSTTSSSSSVSLATTMSSSSSSSRKPTSSIASLPSFAHSLSSFPNMTAVTSDMVHYGNLGRTKQASEAKLNTALQATRQRKSPSSPHSPLTTPTSPLDDPLDWPSDEEALVIPRRKSTKSSSTKTAL